MPLSRDEVVRTLRAVLPIVPGAEVRLVGTASSVLRGIDLPAGDIDVLFRERSDVDAWAEPLARRYETDEPPNWIDTACQYFARFIVDGVVVELSTVEIERTRDTIETYGPGPWLHFDTLSIDGTRLALVATELRLLTELMRSRPDRYRPILAYLRDNGADTDLVRRGLENLGAHNEVIYRVLSRLEGIPY